MAEEFRSLFRGKDNPYRTAIKIGMIVGGAVGLLYGGVEGLEFANRHEIYHPITDVIRDDFPIYFFPVWVMAKETLSVFSDIINVNAGAFLGAIGGGFMGGAVGLCGRTFYDMTRIVLKK
jgi:hypothetical protein